MPRHVGIDLGTTFSTIAYLDEAGRPVPVPNRYGALLTPSVVLFEESGTVVVGHEAKKAAPFEPGRVVECVKRDMGADCLSHPVPGLELTPEEVSALILRRLKEDFVSQVGPIAGAVITVPAYFDDRRRKATRDAGEIAGLNVTAVVNEPVAAALAFSLQETLSQAGAGRKGLLRDALKAKTSLVFDLGGGTFDVTIVRSDGREVRTIATDGDVQLGGKDWDDRLVGWLAERFAQTHGTDPRNDPAAVADLHVAAEEAKRSLSSRVTVPIRIQVAGSRFTTNVTREQFEELTADLLEQARTTTELVVDDSEASWRDINNVLLVGGSSKMPAVRRMLQEVSGMTPDASLAADLAVAQGAAIYAAILAAKRAKAAESEEPVEELPFEGEVLTTLDEIEVHHINSHSLGVVALRHGKKVNSVLIKKNTPIPHAVTKTYGLERNSQRSIDVVVLEGEAKDPMACSCVGRFRVVDLPDGMPRGAPVRVTCRYDADGRIHVEATDLTSGNVGRIEVSRPHGLPPERKEQVAQAVRKLIIE